jgi:hypothetical protein
MGTELNVDWSKDIYWKNRRISPAQIQIHDIRLAENPFHPHQHNFLEIYETLTSTLVDDLRERDRLYEKLNSRESTSSNRQEFVRLQNLVREYGWMNCLRSRGVQQSVDDPSYLRKCRWIHISSKFPEYLEGALVALSDWDSHPDEGRAVSATLRQLDQCIQENVRTPHLD